MCGLVGIAGNLLYQDEFTMKRLLLFDFFRGEHSTGMAAIRTNGDAVISKIASDPIQLFGLKSFYNALNGTASRAFIGHNRHATRGGVNTVNAHPFQFGPIIGAHNGTLDYSSFRRLQDALGEEFAVDSMAIFAGFERLGVSETMSLLTEGKDAKEGAWALVWFDQRDKTLNFLRNKHRQLFYAYEEGFKRMFWASEWWMLREAMDESTNKYKPYFEKKSNGQVAYFLFEPDVHYKYDLAELCRGSTKKPKPLAKQVKGREAEKTEKNVVPFNAQQHEQWFRPAKTDGTPSGDVGNQSFPQKTGCSGTHSTTTSRRSEHRRNLIQLSGDEKHPYANIIDEEKFALSYSDQCNFCGKPVKFGDAGITIFERDARVLCRTCSGYEESNDNAPVRIYVRGNVIDQLS